MPMLLRVPYPDTLIEPFAPTDVAGLVVWFKADAGTFQNDDGTTDAVADGDPVGYWADQSSSGYNVTNTSTARPLLKTDANGINSKPVLRGDGSNDRLIGANPFAHNVGTGNFWWLMVFKPITHVGTNCLVAIQSYAPGWYMRLDSSNKQGVYFGANLIFDTVLSNGTVYLGEVGRESGTIKAVLNGTAEATTFADKTGNIANMPLYLFDSAGSEFGNFDLAEFIFYANKPSEDDLDKLRTYLNNRWDVGVIPDNKLLLETSDLLLMETDDGFELEI